jgi:hypothetical protein
MVCHNGSQENDYGGPGLENPHPYGTGAALNLTCTACHGGNPSEFDALASHVPPPPAIGDAQQLIDDRARLLQPPDAGRHRQAAGLHRRRVTYEALDFLQFINPGDLRVVTDGRACGACHAPHADSVATSMLATEVGILAGSSYAAGIENQVPASVGLYEDTAGDFGFRAVQDPAFGFDPDVVGPVSELLEFPVISQFGVTGPAALQQSGLRLERHRRGPEPRRLADRRDAARQPLPRAGGLHLRRLPPRQRGANNRYGDYRSSGCTACHMRYTRAGAARTGDPNVNTTEPIDVDDIDPPGAPAPEART